MSYIFFSPVLPPQKAMYLREHFYFKETFIYLLSARTILDIIQSSAWQTLGQGITSAETNNDANTEPTMDKVKAGENTCGVDAFC